MSELGDPERVAARYLALVDRLLPGRVVGFYLTGSTSLGAYRPGRSDIDFVGVIDGDLSDAEVRRLRIAHVGSGIRTTARALRNGHIALPGTVNGCHVRATDLTRPATTIHPIASHVAHSFHRGGDTTLNPVLWKELADGGVPLRGPAAATLGLDPEPERLRAWNLENLEHYWVRWAERATSGRRANRFLVPTGWAVAWGVLGAPRLHYTIATGSIISKEGAGEYALDVFDEEWHPIIRDGLAFTRFESPVFKATRSERIARTGMFVHEVVRSARESAG